jgi:hypothetical protein
MSGSSRIENAQATHEALEAVASRSCGSSAHLVATATRRYLSAEQYHEVSKDEGPFEGRSEPTDEAG